MKIPKIRNLITGYLEKARMMQVATSAHDKPWACTVYFAHDTDMNLYWISPPETRHSIEMRKNCHVAGTIVLPHLSDDVVRGIQFEGMAHELLDPSDVQEGMKQYANRYGMSTERVGKILDGSDGHVCYKIKPTVFVLFDEVNFPENPRQKYSV